MASLRFFLINADLQLSAIDKTLTSNSVAGISTGALVLLGSIAIVSGLSFALLPQAAKYVFGMLHK